MVLRFGSSCSFVLLLVSTKTEHGCMIGGLWLCVSVLSSGVHSLNWACTKALALLHQALTRFHPSFMQLDDGLSACQMHVGAIKAG